jgi:hypothetical protein
MASAKTIGVQRQLVPATAHHCAGDSRLRLAVLVDAAMNQVKDKASEPLIDLMDDAEYCKAEWINGGEKQASWRG